MLHEIWINAEPEKVYKALNTREGLSSWWTSNTEGEPTIGGTIKFGFYDGKYWMKFKVISLDEDKKIEWECIDADSVSNDWIGTRITFELERNDNLTILKLNHGNWKENFESFGRCNSTWGHLMFSLKNFVENGKGQPMS